MEGGREGLIGIARDRENMGKGVRGKTRGGVGVSVRNGVIRRETKTSG